MCFLIKPLQEYNISQANKLAMLFDIFIWFPHLIKPWDDTMSLLYGLQKQGEAYLLPTWHLYGHRCHIDQLSLCWKTTFCCN